MVDNFFLTGIFFYGNCCMDIRHKYAFLPMTGNNVCNFLSLSEKAVLKALAFRFFFLLLRYIKCQYDMNTNFTKDSVESAYCFFHQKLRVYEYSTSPTQRDDIEYAISQYIDEMNPSLYQLLAGDRKEFLLDHTRFEEDMREAQAKLEKMM